MSLHASREACSSPASTLEAAAAALLLVPTAHSYTRFTSVSRKPCSPRTLRACVSSSSSSPTSWRRASTYCAVSQPRPLLSAASSSTRLASAKVALLLLLLLVDALAPASCVSASMRHCGRSCSRRHARQISSSFCFSSSFSFPPSSSSSTGSTCSASNAATPACEDSNATYSARARNRGAVL